MSNRKNKHLEGSRYKHDPEKEEENTPSQNSSSPAKMMSSGGIGWAEEIRQRAREALNKQQKLKQPSAFQSNLNVVNTGAISTSNLLAGNNSSSGVNSFLNNNKRGRGGEWFQNQPAPNGGLVPSESEGNPSSNQDSHPPSRGRGFHLEDINPKRQFDLTDEFFKKTEK